MQGRAFLWRGKPPATREKRRPLTRSSEITCVQISLICSLAERLCRFDNLVRPGTNPIVFRQVYPPHVPRRIQQKLGRPRNILLLDSCTGVKQVIAANHVGFWIRKKRK